jgi:hypothetical protein
MRTAIHAREVEHLLLSLFDCICDHVGESWEHFNLLGHYLLHVVVLLLINLIISVTPAAIAIIGSPTTYTLIGEVSSLGIEGINIIAHVVFPKAHLIRLLLRIPARPWSRRVLLIGIAWIEGHLPIGLGIGLLLRLRVCLVDSIFQSSSPGSLSLLLCKLSPDLIGFFLLSLLLIMLFLVLLLLYLIV